MSYKFRRVDNYTAVFNKVPMLSQLFAVNNNFATIGFGETANQLHQNTLSATVFTDYSNAFSCFNSKIYSGKYAFFLEFL